MKKIAFITPVPDMVKIIIEQSMLRKAHEENIVEYFVVDLREFGKGNYRQIDDSPYGGGSGMVMMAEPMMAAIESAKKWMKNTEDVRIIYPSPQGKTWNHQQAESFSDYENLIFICGHYKGLDHRVIEKCVTDELSIGDYVVSSGEIPAMIIADSVVRLIPGVLNSRESAETDSFYGDLLDNPYFTKPRQIDGMDVPEVLLNGNHKKIDNWKQLQRENITKVKRPDLWRKQLEKK